MITGTLVNQTANLLNRRAGDLAHLELGPAITWSITFEKIREGFENGEVPKMVRSKNRPEKGDLTLYRLFVETESARDSLSHAFLGRSEAACKYKTARENSLGDSMTIYVGSSRAFPTRLREHVFRASSYKTYALHLHKWKPKGNYKLYVECQTLGERSACQQILQDLEDALWIQEKPVFGKKGAL